MNWNHYLSYSYAPGSKQPSAAIIEAENGLFYPGVGIENMSHPLTITAVQAAVFSSLADGTNPRILYTPNDKTEPLISYWIDEFDLKISSKHIPEKAPFYNPVISKQINVKSKLNELISFSVTPNSNFPVTALLEIENGYIPGVNIECSAWNLGLCAERIAILRALSAGYKKFKSILIFAPESDFISPCGACRQVLAEWMNLRNVYLFHGDGSRSRHILKHLLPYGFTSFDLNKGS